MLQVLLLWRGLRCFVTLLFMQAGDYMQSTNCRPHAMSVTMSVIMLYIQIRGDDCVVVRSCDLRSFPLLKYLQYIHLCLEIHKERKIVPTNSDSHHILTLAVQMNDMQILFWSSFFPFFFFLFYIWRIVVWNIVKVFQFKRKKRVSPKELLPEGCQNNVPNEKAIFFSYLTSKYPLKEYRPLRPKSHVLWTHLSESQGAAQPQRGLLCGLFMVTAGFMIELNQTRHTV